MNQKKYEEKVNRLNSALALQEDDRVPFAPKTCCYYANGYNLNMYDVMKDMRNVEPGIRQFLKEFDPDIAWPVATYPIDPVLALDCNQIKVPGPTHSLPLNSSFQFLDGKYLEDDEFDEFLMDPTHFTLTKILPRKNKNLKGFEKLYFREFYDQSSVMSMAILSNEDVRKAFQAAMKAGDAAQEAIAQNRYIANLINEEGYPQINGRMVAPFDIYADSIRGLIQAVMDIHERPEQVLEVLERIEAFNLNREIKAAKARGAKIIFIPLHSGVDEFMSCADYEKFYWPGLKRIIEGLCEAGITPYVFCEGKYNSRLEIISDVPKNKVIYMFEQVDIKRAKETVGKVACICGNIPTATLVYGNKQTVIDKTKEMLDICAPGGGFIMDCSIIIDNANRENMEAWRDTTLTYGKY